MPLNTVQTTLQKILNNLQIPGNQIPLSAYITPPDPGQGTDPAVYVWGSTGDDMRRSMPRGPGFRLIKHEIDLWLIWFGPSDASDSDVAFPAIIDVVCQRLRTTPMPVLKARDPLTGQLSNIEMIGERLRWDYAPVHSTEDQRWLVYTARIICDVREQVQA